MWRLVARVFTLCFTQRGDIMNKKLIILSFIFAFSIFNTSCTRVPVIKTISTGPNFFLNSVLDIKILDEDISTDDINKLISTRVEALENLLTTHNESSEISKINQNAGISPVAISEDTFLVIKEGLKYSKLSEGKFDITIGPLVDLWGIGTEDARLPEDSEIKEALSHIGYDKVLLDEKKNTVFLTEPNMAIDVGAIAKGYVADEINDILASYKIKSAIINLGGNIYARGSKNGEPFKIGLKDPESKNSDYLGVYKGTDVSIVTSGTYERYFEQNGARYHHILSTNTGYPVENEIAAVTIISKNSMMADALSTSVFALGIEKGFALIDSLPNVDAIIITNSKKIIMSREASRHFELTNDSYEIEYRN